ncbi:MAG: DUF2058 domain-containing protein [Gammaproteobacteria bacterium]|nr:MAG: DUF2058 domain-containing protein [Gammaproteobacteria bacterium]
MSQSVRDQLLKLGLADERKLSEAKRQDRAGARKAKKARKSKPRNAEATGAGAEPENTRSRAEAALKQRAERDREASRKRRLNEERSARKAQIAQIIDRRREPRSKGEIPYNFVHGKKIKRIYVTQALLEGLSGGHMGVVRTGERFEVVRREIIERLQEIDPNCVVSLHDLRSESDADDPYADKPIPDDLMW